MMKKLRFSVSTVIKMQEQSNPFLNKDETKTMPLPRFLRQSVEKASRQLFKIPSSSEY